MADRDLLNRELLTCGEVAAIFRVHPKTVAEWEKQGRIRAALRTLGGHRRYDRADLQEFLGGDVPVPLTAAGRLAVPPRLTWIRLATGAWQTTYGGKSWVLLKHPTHYQGNADPGWYLHRAEGKTLTDTQWAAVYLVEARSRAAELIAQAAVREVRT